MIIKYALCSKDVELCGCLGVVRVAVSHCAFLETCGLDALLEGGVAVRPSLALQWLSLGCWSICSAATGQHSGFVL